MSAEFWAVVGIGITVLVATAAEHRDTRQQLHQINSRLDSMNERLSRLEGRFDEMSRWSKDLLEALVHRPAA